MGDYVFCPLPNEVVNQSSISQLDRANKGLVFERFFAGYDRQFSEIDTSSKETAIDRVSGHVGDAEQLTDYQERMSAMMGAVGGRSVVFTTDWNMVTGMGINSPIENGFSWHPTLGVPYLPGSTIKGMLRTWFSEYAGLEAETITAWFGGDAASDNESGAGTLIVFDALPKDRPLVGSDIMTPHAGKWYEKGGSGKEVPGDWHAPVPVPFLVTKEAKFVFSIGVRRGCKADLDQVMEGLVHALAWLGAGAKTAAGYGHMSPDQSATESMARLRLSENQRFLIKLKDQLSIEMKGRPQGLSTDFTECLRKWVEQASIDDWTMPELRELLAVAEKGLKFHSPSNWNKLTKKKKPSLYMKIKALIDEQFSKSGGSV